MFSLCLQGASKGELVQVIVAEDLFKELVQDPQQLLVRATYAGARSWAGKDEVFRGLMMNYLYDGCPAAHAFVKVHFLCPMFSAISLLCTCFGTCALLFLYIYQHFPAAQLLLTRKTLLQCVLQGHLLACHML
jgi:hypothetical protein